MNKKQIVSIVGVTLTIAVISTVTLNYYLSELEFESNNTLGQLDGILGSCACKERVNTNPDTVEKCPQPFIDWQNSTHYIDNQICTFLDTVEDSPTHGLPIEYDKPLCLPPYDENLGDDCIQIIEPIK